MSEMSEIDQVGRHFARYYSVPPMTGRVAGWLLICDPPEQTVGQLADALLASRSAIGTAVATLENWSLVRRSRTAGERADRIALHPAIQSLGEPTEYVTLGALARHGLETIAGAAPARRERLLELAALAAEWLVHRDALRASGELPDIC